MCAARCNRGSLGDSPGSWKSNSDDFPFLKPKLDHHSLRRVKIHNWPILEQGKRFDVIWTSDLEMVTWKPFFIEAIKHIHYQCEPAVLGNFQYIVLFFCGGSGAFPSTIENSSLIYRFSKYLFFTLRRLEINLRKLFLSILFKIRNGFLVMVN